jgi:hypothetical protein
MTSRALPLLRFLIVTSDVDTTTLISSRKDYNQPPDDYRSVVGFGVEDETTVTVHDFAHSLAGS